VTALYDFVHELGKINSVFGFNELEPVTEFDLTRFDEIQFVCERGIFTVVAEGEFDTVSLKLAEGSAEFKRDISDTEPWIQVLEKPILWAWLLTNEKNYTDGFQFEVRTSDGYVDVQLMCQASSFDVRFVSSL
jgi:hypothetical protein